MSLFLIYLLKKEGYENVIKMGGAGDLGVDIILQLNGNDTSAREILAFVLIYLEFHYNTLPESICRVTI